MVNRRGFLGAVAAISGAVVVPVSASRVVVREPRPTRFDCEETAPYGMDISICSVRQALHQMDWEPDLDPKPLLVVHPLSYVDAHDVREHYRDAIEVWATNHITDRDTWFVSWRGRRVGSVGA